MDQLLAHLHEIAALEPDLKEYLKSVIKTTHHKKGDILVRPGDIAKRISFIEKGLIRSYRLEKKAEEIAYFVTEGDTMISIRSFLTQIPAMEYIECMEDSILHSISFDELRYGYKKYRSFQEHRAELLQKYYLLSAERNDMHKLPTFDRYCFLIEKQPHLIGRVRDKLLASYLNMAKSTFSRKKGEYQKMLKEKARKKRC